MALNDIRRVSVGPNGEQGLESAGVANSELDAEFSPDGTKVFFASSAANLVPGDVEPGEDLFLLVKDLVTGGITIVNITPYGAPSAYFGSNPVAISPDGNTIAFLSYDLSHAPGLYTKNLQTGVFTLIATGYLGLFPFPPQFPTFSPDGNEIAFVAFEPNPGNDTHDPDLYIKNLTTGSYTRIPSGNPNIGFVGDHYDLPPEFSRDGTKLLFSANNSSLAAGGLVGKTDIYVEDLGTGAITRVSVTADGAHSAAGLVTPDIFDVQGAKFSPDGTKVAFSSRADLVDGDTNGLDDIFVKDLASGAIKRVSTASDGAQSAYGGNSDPISDINFSPDGTKIIFTSNAINLVPGDTNNASDVFVKDLVTGEIARISVGVGGVQGNGASFRGSFSPDGASILFSSDAGNLVAGDTNGATDVFIVSFEIAPKSQTDVYKAGYDKPLTVSAAPGVLTNDSDANHDALRAVLVSGPAHGTVALKGDGSFTYTPDGKFVGADTFVYHAYDGAKYGADTTVTLNVMGNIERVSTRADASEAFYGATFDAPHLSPDGRSVLFTSGSTDLGSLYRYTNVFEKNLDTGAVTLVSARADGSISGVGNASAGVFSPDGAKVVFTSDGFQYTAGSNIYVKDLATGALTLASSSAAGVAGDGYSGRPSFSPDGTKVVFFSGSDNLVSGDTNKGEDIFIKDLATGAISRISTAPDGSQGQNLVQPGVGADSYQPVFSPDGTKVAFVSTDDNLVPGASYGVFVKDLVTGAVTLVSSNASGAGANGFSEEPVFSPDGMSVAFSSSADNLVPGDTNHLADIFVKNLATGAITRVSTDADGHQAVRPGTDGSSFPAFSPDGTRIAFYSAAALVPGQASVFGAVYEKNLVTGAVRLVSSDAFETPGDGRASRPSYSGDGKLIVFSASDDNLVPGDTNHQGDIFIKDLTKHAYVPPTPPTGQGTDGDDTILALKDFEALIGGAGDDTYFLVGSGDTVTEGAGGGMDVVHTPVNWVATSGSEIEKIVADGAASLQLAGNGLSLEIDGNAAVNKLDDGGGQDTVAGGGGSDVYVVHNALTQVVEAPGAGYDAVQTDLSSYSLPANVESLTFIGTGNFSGFGNAGGNLIVGGAGDDYLDGGAGAGVDRLVGGKGDDIYVVHSAQDYVVEKPGEGTDTVMTTANSGVAAPNVEALSFIGAGDFTGFANATGVTLTGGAGNDHLYGGAGADRLVGLGGSDVLTGKGGADVFVLGGGGAGTGGGVDRVTDFHTGEDHVAFGQIVTKVLFATDTFNSATAGGGAGADYLFYDQATGRLYDEGSTFAVSGGHAVGGTGTLIATFDAHPSLSAGDFIL